MVPGLTSLLLPPTGTGSHWHWYWHGGRSVIELQSGFSQDDTPCFTTLTSETQGRFPSLYRCSSVMVGQWPIPQTEPGFLANLIPELQWMDLQLLHSTLHRVTTLLDTLLDRICALLDRLIDEISKPVRHSQLFSCVSSLCSFRLL